MHKASFNSRLFKHLIAWQQHFNNSRLGPVLACAACGNSFWNPAMELWIPFLRARAQAEIERRDRALWIQSAFPFPGAWERYMFYVPTRDRSAAGGCAEFIFQHAFSCYPDFTEWCWRKLPFSNEVSALEFCSVLRVSVSDKAEWCHVWRPSE